ncbi:glutamate--cysteine ligase [Georgenia sp. EYE_87]|uniref:carboxylate-amine ligase n=1 Tax=Georgenia sp. EYE_87 TaxID=2853448 RepID=UPI002003A970|nr:glutamate--cysteine ligase [Georgenia sp. EYE_87]MCK6211156.1 glutamate--cysteine ligase [Georgenia sp. EYE_87]
MRTVGVEEELLLVESATGRALSVAGQVLARATERAARAVGAGPAGAGPAGAAPAGTAPATGPGGLLERELQQQQIEADTRPHTDLDALEGELRGWRATASDAARQVGARVAAVGLCPTPVVPRTVDSARYRTMVDRFGILTTEHLTCGCHVHVSVDSREEAVGVLDRIRVWLPPLLALSSNSPYWQGRDTAYASYRYLMQNRWPSAGPSEIFGSVRAYDELVEKMVRTGAILDTGMVYFDARASARYPTVEIRVADVCLDPADTVMIAALCRALVDTAAVEWAEGRPPPAVPGMLLRLAGWQAGREGVGGALLDPVTLDPAPAWDVLGGLLEHVRPALRANGDVERVEAGFDRVLAHGTGADRQRAVMGRTGRLVDVVAFIARATAGMED